MLRPKSTSFLPTFNVFCLLCTLPMPFAFGYVEGIHAFPRDPFKCPWQGKRDTGKLGERKGWHSHLQPVLNTALSPGQIATPYVLLGQQRWGWEERGLHSPWQILLPACGTQEVLLPQVEEEEEKQDFSLMAVLLGLIGNRPTKGGIFHTACLEADSTRKTIRRCPFGFLTAEAKHQLGSFALQYTQTE